MESKPVTEKTAEWTGSKAGQLDNKKTDAGYKIRKPGTGMSAAPHGKTDGRRSATQFKNKVRP
jgi:hypothetical protein